MAKNITIKLDKPLAGHAGPVTQVVIREPTFNEYLDIGDPYVVAQAPVSGIPFILEDKAAIATYARTLIVEPTDPLLLEQGGMVLARKIKEAIKSFFLVGGEADAVSSTLPTS